MGTLGNRDCWLASRSDVLVTAGTASLLVELIGVAA